MWPDVAGAFPALDSPQVLLGPLHVLGTRLDVPLGAFWPYLLALASSTWAADRPAGPVGPPHPPPAPPRQLLVARGLLARLPRGLRCPLPGLLSICSPVLV